MYAQSILEKEAAVQNHPRNPAAWFELGVKQQENERELSAIQALQRAVELDPSYLEAWLALAISHGNENDRNGAYDAIEHWVRNNGRYEGAQLMALLESGEKTAKERHEALIQCLMGLARTAPEGEIDADIQTALGVLLNTSEVGFTRCKRSIRVVHDVNPRRTTKRPKIVLGLRLLYDLMCVSSSPCVALTDHSLLSGLAVVQSRRSYTSKQWTSG